MNVSKRMAEVYLDNGIALRKLAEEILEKEPKERELAEEILKQASEMLVKAKKCADVAMLEMLYETLLK